jgi:hypothetical protein
VQHHYDGLAVEYVEQGSYLPVINIAIPLDAMADFEGRENSLVILEAAAPDRMIVRWEDRGIPQTREYDLVTPVDQIDAVPELPATWRANLGELLDALAQANEICMADSPRYALHCIQLQGSRGQIVATDGHQIFSCSGFDFPWDSDLLIRGLPVFASKAFSHDQPVQVGKTETHVVFRSGDWTIWSQIVKDARFPNVDQVLPDIGAGTTRLRLDPEDARFLESALDRLPARDETFSPVTLDLNGSIVLRARGADQPQVTELVLNRSSYSGTPLRLNTNRIYLGRALHLGLREVAIPGVEMPLVCRDHGRLYVWQPLSANAAIGPGEHVIRIESGGTSSSADQIRTGSETPRRTMSGTAHHRTSRSPEPTPANGHAQSTERSLANGHKCTGGPVMGNGHAGTENSGTSLAGLIQEAEGLHTALSEVKSRTARLIAGLRRHRKQSRLVQETLKSLRQLKLSDVVA